jgi:cellulose synthase/poly-beta-1,6-N-acetylglucosamine synthase-like glycosyltransferase
MGWSACFEQIAVSLFMLHTLFIISAGLLAVYGLLILLYRKWFMLLEPFEPRTELAPLTHFSIVIPARDEEGNIAACLSFILANDYPSHLFEIIVINDHSTDQTAAIVEGFQINHPSLKLINLAEHTQIGLNAYKKKAIELAIAETKGDWIITTDADCVVNQKWLSLLDAYIQETGSIFVAAPVQFRNNGSFISLFQVLDFLSLQGITAAAVGAGAHSMCNGANLAYQKKAFYEVGQFKGIDQIASGDDMLLMQKMKQANPGKLGYLFNQNAIVITLPMPNWKQLFNQRIRWASKGTHYKDKSIFWVLLLVYLMNLSILLLFLVGLFQMEYLTKFFYLLLLKTGVELYFLYPVSRFFGQSAALLYFPIMQPMHICYTVIAGWLGKFGSYQWKGRKTT